MPCTHSCLRARGGEAGDKTALAGYAVDKAPALELFPRLLDRNFADTQLLRDGPHGGKGSAALQLALDDLGGYLLEQLQIDRFVR